MQDLKKLIYLLLLLYTTVANAQVNNLNNKSKQLKIFFDKGFVNKGKDSSTYQKLFFNAFPANFSLLNTLYGYDDKKGPGYLSTNALEHIDKLFTVKAVSSEEKAKKFVRIAINGTWDSDGINFFQNNLQRFVVNNFAPFLSELNKHTDSEVESVWKFYFDIEASDYRERYYNTVLSKLEKNKRMIKIINTAYKKATLEQKH